MIRASAAKGIVIAAVFGALAASCEGPQTAPPPAPETSAAPSTQGAASSTAAVETASCQDERGQADAQRLADRCRQVSPATNPPCNVANPCARIQGEIDRACALWAEDGDVPAECAG